MSMCSGRPVRAAMLLSGSFLDKKAAERAVPMDWCYVSDFDEPRKPRALALPPGRSQELRTDVERVIQDAQTAIPAAFESEDFQAQREAIAEEFKDVQEKRSSRSRKRPKN